jgi:hypothetical protein
MSVSVCARGGGGGAAWGPPDALRARLARGRSVAYAEGIVGPKHPPRPSSPPTLPKQRKTIEVEISWLEPNGEEPGRRYARRRRPVRPPPLPVEEISRNTIPVRAEWLETAEAVTPAAAVPATNSPPPGFATSGRRKVPPPIPREDSLSSPTPTPRKEG